MRRRPIDEEPGIEGDAAVRIGIELHHPTFQTLWIELRIDRAVERVREIHPPAVPADLDHLRPAVERPPGLGMARPRYHSANSHFSGELRVERIGNVILL